jgi:hypothetical protein
MAGKYKLAPAAPAAPPLKSDARRKKLARLGPTSPALKGTAWHLKKSRMSSPTGPASPALHVTKK